MDDYFLPRENLQVQPSVALPTVTPQQMGAGVGAGISIGGEVATRIYHDHNAIAALAAQNQLTDWSTNALYHPEKGVLHQESGKDAPALVNTTLTDYEKKTSEIADGLANDDQRATFLMAADQHAQSMKRQLYGYEHAQVTQYADRQTQSYIANSRNAAVQQFTVQGPTSPQQTGEITQSIHDEIGKQQAAIADMGSRNALPPETVQQMQADAASQTHLEVIEQLYHSGQDQTAKAWFEAHRQDLTEPALTRATAMVRDGSTEDEARGIADGLVSEKDANEETALQSLRDMHLADTKVNDRASERVRKFYREQREAHTAVQQDVMQQVDDALSDENNHEHRVPPDVYSRLDLPHKRAVDTYIKHLSDEGKPKTTDDGLAALTEVRTMAADHTRWDELANLDETTLKGDLSESDYRTVGRLKAGAIGAVSKRDETLSKDLVTAAASDKVFSSYYLAAGDAKPAAPKPGQAASSAYLTYAGMRQRFQTQFDAQVIAKQQKEKRALLPEEVDDIAKDLFATQTWQQDPSWFDRNIPTPLTFLSGVTGGAVPDRIWDSTKASGPLFTAPWADKLVYSADKIPPSYLQAMRKNDKTSGIVRDEDALVRDYNTHVVKQWALAQTKATP